MTVLLLLLLGCGSEPQPVQSTPVKPVVELGGDQPQTPVTWATLEGLLPMGEPGFPPALAGLELGQPEANARAVLDKARNPKLILPEDQELDDATVTSARLLDFEAVGVTLILRGGKLDQVDLSLPAEESIFAATQSWGKPDDQVVGNSTVPQPVWVHEGLQAKLIQTKDGPAILKYSKVE